MTDAPPLTELQVALLRVLWGRGEATVADICAELRTERPLAPTTVATLLSRLEKRGVVRHRTVARQYVYRAAVSEQDVRSSMVGELTEQLFDGDVAALVSHLLTSQAVGPDDLQKVRALLAERLAGKDANDDTR